MSTGYVFLALEQDNEQIANWFGAIDIDKTVTAGPDGTWYYYRGLATSPLPAAVEIDQATTPLVCLMHPQRRLRTLWTGGEVLFTPTPLRMRFPELDRVAAAFRKWLRTFDVVFSLKDPKRNEWNYYLEGQIRCYTSEIVALPEAMRALRKGQYFVDRRDTPVVLDKLSKQLRLRGYDVDPA